MSFSGFRHLTALTAILFSHAVLSFTAFSQSAVIEKTHDIITKDGISIASTLQHCESLKNGTSKEYVLLSIFNENPYPVRVSFKRNLWFDGKCASCNSSSPEYIVSLTIEANQKREGNCEDSNDLRLFSKMLNLDNVRKLTNYELVDITVNEVK